MPDDDHQALPGGGPELPQTTQADAEPRGATSGDASATGNSGPPIPPQSSSWKPALAWCLAKLRLLGIKAWNFAGEVARYYWGIRRLLWEYLAGLAPNMMSESLRMREVRLAPYASHRFAEFVAESWKIAIPGRCVVCGERTAVSPVDEELAIDDAARAFLVPLGTIFAGALLALIYSRWLFLISIPLGLSIGYLLRHKMPVHLRVARCEPHAARTNIPQVLVWGHTLVLRFGHKLVRKVFLYGETVDSAVPMPDVAVASVPAVEEPPVEKPPETIPLADSPHPDDAVIRHDPPAVFRPEDEPRSPLVP